MKIFLIVEGDSDKILFDSQRRWFDYLGLELDIVPTYGKQNMIKTAKKHYKISIIRSANSIVFLPDQNGDVCALVTRQRIGINSLDKAVTIVIKREIEAWVLADGQCIRDSIHVQYSPAGQTDMEVDPKQKLHSILKSKFGYLPTNIEAAKMLASNFSINRAAMNNTSAKRFKEFIESVVGSSGYD